MLELSLQSSQFVATNLNHASDVCESQRCRLYFQLFFSILCLSTCLSICVVFSISQCLKSFLLSGVQVLQLHGIVYSKCFLDLSETQKQTSMLCICYITVQPSCSLPRLNAKGLQCKALLAVNDNFNRLQQTQQPKRFIVTI